MTDTLETAMTAAHHFMLAARSHRDRPCPERVMQEVKVLMEALEKVEL